MLRSLSLRTQITVLVALLSVALSCLLAFAAASVAHQRSIGRIKLDIAGTAQALATALDTGLAERYREVRNIAEFLPLQDMWAHEPRDVRPLLEQLKVSFPAYAWIGFARADGTVHAATHRMLEGQSVVSRPWFQDGLKGPAVGDVHEAKLLATLLTRVDNEPFRFVDVAAPVRDASGAVIGVLGAHLSWSWASEIRQELLGRVNNPDQEIWILSSDGTILLGPRLPSQPFAPEQIAAMKREKKGALEEGGMLTGFSVAEGYRDYPGFGWIVVSRLPAGIAFAYATNIAVLILVLGLIVAVVGIFAAWFVAKVLVKPLQKLTDAADLVGRDRHVAMLPLVGGSREVARLSATLRSLLRRAGIAEAQMVEHEQRSQEAVAQHQKDLSDLRRLAETDALTGLLNRRGFEILDADAMSRYRTKGSGFGILVIDIDHFKRVNDAYGHGVGDDALKTVAKTLASNLRPTDTIARFGGEEFVVLLNDVSHDAIIRIAQGLRRAIEATPVVSGDLSLSINVSIGGAIVSDQDRDVQDVIERADGALYEAKSAGRNRVIVGSLQHKIATNAA
jgi:diguanylate cyclase (GGDEF)-like protein